MVNDLIELAKKTPYFHLDGYMERYWLKPFNADDPINIRIHHLLSSDSDRALHDHPWPSTSIILKGGYWEIMPELENQDPKLDQVLYSKVWRKPGDVIHRKATSRHRIMIEPNNQEPVWSMFIMGPYEQTWGFYTPEGKVYWREFLDDWTTITTTDKPSD